jgi:hypothetical protein
LFRRSLPPTKLKTSLQSTSPSSKRLLTFEQGRAALEKYCAKYPKLASYIREIVPGERRIEIRQRLEGEDINLHLFAIRVLEDEARNVVKLSGDAEHKTVKPPEWLSLLHDKLARIVAKILYAPEYVETGKAELRRERTCSMIPGRSNAPPLLHPRATVSEITATLSP